MTTLYLLTIALATLQLGDWFTTKSVLAKGGKELNPVAKKLMDTMTIDGFLAVKSFTVTALGYYAGSQHIEAIAILVVVYCVVVGHNFKELYK